MNIIGISALFHDSACCLIQDGKLVAAVEEERFTGIKHDSSMPSEAFRYCLKAGEIDISEVDALAFFENPTKKLGRQLWMTMARLQRGLEVDPGLRLDASRAEWEIRNVLGFSGPIEYFDHHLSHAAGSYYFSGFQDAAIMTFDGVGEWTTTSYGAGSGADIDLFKEVEFPDSLGLLYSTITSYLGFSVNDAEYKVMGLAPYGKPLFMEQVRTLIANGEHGAYHLRPEYFDFVGGNKMYSPLLPELFGRPPRESESVVEQFHKDVARSLQSVLEELLLEKAKYLHSVVPSRNLCLSGGVALNCVANGRILRDGPFENMFVQPAAGDAGSALGAAALAHVKLTGKRPSKKQLQHVYLGPASSNDEIAKFLKDASVESANYQDQTDRLLSEVADRLEKQEVIGWFHGRTEFGPRSLGARSILADPRNPEMRDRINAFVKKREAFRPFAPSVLEEKVSSHFKLDHPSRFMLETCQVTSPLSLPAITHVDGSARVQTVSDKISPRYAKLLRYFDARTGCPILLNTSFNLRGEPIVLTPYDAFWCFVRSDIDCLVLENFIIDRSMIPESWLTRRAAHEAAGGTRPIDYGIAHNVYTFF